jgi:molecular chaperone DnaK
MKIRKTVGIDLGTTNSVIALLDPTDSALLTGQDEQGRRTVPSIVGYHPEQERLLVGRAAAALRGPGRRERDLTLPLSSVKRFMGLDRDFRVGPETLTPPQASAMILRHLRDLMARTLNDPRYLLDSAIITMPAYFNHNQIEATRLAGELAGYDVVELLHEPTAAAIYYSWVENHGDATYLVYDLGGGTFDVSVIRRRLGDYEVLSVSGDPFLGGDDFDRLLASFLVEAATWNAELGTRSAEREDAAAEQPEAASRSAIRVPRSELEKLFDISTPPGAANFARLVHIAEGIKIDLTDSERVERYAPGLVFDRQGRRVGFEATVERGLFQRLIREKVQRTIDCCREALGRAKERAGIGLSDIDYVILVGGSSRLPLVRETVKAAFCNADLPEHVRCLEPLLHEPDLCVAYGAALRAATHGTKFQCPVRKPGEDGPEDLLELNVTSPANTRDTQFQITGVVRLLNDPDDAGPSEPRTPYLLDGGSVRVRSLASGLLEEAFLDERGAFVQDVELRPETDNVLELTVCDGAGGELGRAEAVVRHQSASRALGQGVLPTQLITKPLQIEVLSRSRQRVKQVVAPIGSPLPGVFHCTCRTHDQTGRIVVPIFEENRVVKQIVIDDLDPRLPVGSPVEVEFAIDVKHNIEVKVRVRQGEGRERVETATIEAPPPPRRPTRAEIDEVQAQIDEQLGQLSGSYRTKARSRRERIYRDLVEALRYEDEPKAIQRMAELRELLQELEARKGQALDPPWPRFAQLVRQCLDLAAQVSDATGRDREELFEYVHAQERYAEQAYEDQNPALYRECRENLERYAGYLNQLLRDTLPRPMGQGPSKPPEEEAKDDLERFRSFLASVWKQVKAKKRDDLDQRMGAIAGQARGLNQRLKDDPHGVTRDARRLGAEVYKIEQALKEGRPLSAGDDAGLLEGSS